MSVHTLLIYGSRARGDYSKDSDIDLLAITSEKQYKVIVNGKINTVCYSEELAFEKSRNGDLFMLHIIEEGKPIYDDSGYFEKLKSCFQYKNNYSFEIQTAADLSWMLIDLESEILNYALFNRRIAWCVRTILIAIAAERHFPTFSARDLALSTDAPFVEQLISGKTSNVRSKDNLKKFEKFLKHLNFSKPILSKKNLPAQYLLLFKNTGNEIGLKTLKSLNSESFILNYSNE
jgi:hypothetical protein